MSLYNYHLGDAPLVLRFEENTDGRDFFLTDPHGAYDTVLRGMKKVAFDPNVDRMFGGGDYCDRGEDSARARKFLRQHYVKGARGNHCQFVIDLYANGTPHDDVIRWAARQNGFGWWLNTPEDQRQEILTEFRKLPIVIEVMTARGKVGIVHADIPRGMDWDTFVRKIEERDQDVIHTALWGRERVAAMDDEGRPVNGGHPDFDGVPGIDRVFVGHTPQWGGTTRYGNVYACDTGAIFGETGMKANGRLTIAELACTTQVLTSPSDAILVDIRADNPFERPLQINRTPFGRYTK
jgi:serine/threonine protein phosphatase 1